MKPTPLINILLGSAIIGSVACNGPTEPRLHTCDTSCTMTLNKFDGHNLPINIYDNVTSNDPNYTAKVVADTLHLAGDSFQRRYTTEIGWPDVTWRFLMTEEYKGSVIRNGEYIELLAEQIYHKNGADLLDTNRMYGILNKNGITLRQDSLYSDENKLIYDDRGVFEYRIVKK